MDPIVNFFQSNIATLPVAIGATSITLQSGAGAKLPNPANDGAFNLVITADGEDPEIVRVTARSGDVITVTRAQEGTVASEKTTGKSWIVLMAPTKKTFDDLMPKSGGEFTGGVSGLKSLDQFEAFEGILIDSRHKKYFKYVGTSNQEVTVLALSVPNVSIAGVLTLDILHSRAPSSGQRTLAYGRFYVSVARGANTGVGVNIDLTNSFTAQGASGGGNIDSILNNPTFIVDGNVTETQTVLIKIQPQTGGGGTGGRFNLIAELIGSSEIQFS